MFIYFIKFVYNHGINNYYTVNFFSEEESFKTGEDLIPETWSVNF